MAEPWARPIMKAIEHSMHQRLHGRRRGAACCVYPGMSTAWMHSRLAPPSGGVAVEFATTECSTASTACRRMETGWQGEDALWRRVLQDLCHSLTGCISTRPLVRQQTATVAVCGCNSHSYDGETTELEETLGRRGGLQVLRHTSDCHSRSAGCRSHSQDVEITDTHTHPHPHACTHTRTHTHTHTHLEDVLRRRGGLQVLHQLHRLRDVIVAQVVDDQVEARLGRDVAQGGQVLRVRAQGCETGHELVRTSRVKVLPPIR